MTIHSFRGEYAYLSNFYNSPIPFELQDGTRTYALTVEHAYQASKLANTDIQKLILDLASPGLAKRRLHRYQDAIPDELVPDFHQNKLRIMTTLVWRKFVMHEDLAKKLIRSHPHQLIEGNEWGDTFWGMIRDDTGWIGENHLGYILMDVRKAMIEADSYLGLHHTLFS